MQSLKTNFGQRFLLRIFILLLVLSFAVSHNFFATFGSETATNTPQTELTPRPNTGQSLEDQLEGIKADLDRIKQERENTLNNIERDKANLTAFQNQIVDLESTVMNLTSSIAQKELEIQKLEIEIQILEEEIERLKKSIEETKEIIIDLEEETDDRLLNMYLSQKQNAAGSTAFFNAGGPSALIKSNTYRQALQEDTNNKLVELEDRRAQLETDQIKVEEDKIELDRSRTAIEDQKIALDVQRTNARNQQVALESSKRDAQNRLEGYDELISVLSNNEKELLAKQDAIQAALLSRNEVANGLPITKGTFLGLEGDTGYSYGAHLHFGVSENGVIKNPCGYLPAGAYGSCGGSGRIGKPMSPGVFTSGFRTRSRPTHNAIDISNGGGTSVVAAHDGFAYFFFEPCPSWAKVCNGGGAIVAKVCETDKCTTGISTSYYHLRCTAEPKSSGRSCQR